jgi:putative FmdB family regulatory protein
MPTYGYACPKCGHEYEKLQKISDQTRTKCPECGTPGERVISGGAGLVFKGSGFYITDYKRAGDSASSASGGKDGDASSSKDGSKDASKSKDTKTSKGEGS